MSNSKKSKKNLKLFFKKFKNIRQTFSTGGCIQPGQKGPPTSACDRSNMEGF
jgi:hypothetical protein